MSGPTSVQNRDPGYSNRCFDYEATMTRLLSERRSPVFSCQHLQSAEGQPEPNNENLSVILDISIEEDGKEEGMPRQSTTQKARKDLQRGKSPSTAAGEFVHEEIEHVRKGKHGARSPQQAIAIGLNKARRAGVPLRSRVEGKVRESARASSRRA